MICYYCGRPVCGYIEDHKCDKGVNVDKIKEAKDFLRTVLGINYNRYIYTKLAGDFAVEVSKELHNLSSQLEEVTRQNENLNACSKVMEQTLIDIQKQRDEAVSHIVTLKTMLSKFTGVFPVKTESFLQSITAESGEAMQKNDPGDTCPKCNAPEVDHNGPQTKYKCGSFDYDQRPGTFKQSEQCKDSRPQV